MLYLDYAKPLADGKYILSFFADSAADLESISHGQKFVTKNGTDYGVPQAGSTVIVTSPNSGKTTYANWTESEIKALAGGSGGKLYAHTISGFSTENGIYYCVFYATFATIVDLNNVDTLNAKIPFGWVYNLNNDGNFVFTGIFNNIHTGLPGQIAFDIEGVSPTVSCEYSDDTVKEV